MLTRLTFILCSFMLVGCGDYAALEAVEVNKRIADSLFQVNKDTLRKQYTVLCDSFHSLAYERAVDSIKILRLEGIQELIKE